VLAVLLAVRGLRMDGTVDAGGKPERPGPPGGPGPARQAGPAGPATRRQRAD
jgi:hypothetical protein